MGLVTVTLYVWGVEVGVRVREMEVRVGAGLFNLGRERAIK